jgi:hypothetical protein
MEFNEEFFSREPDPNETFNIHEEDMPALLSMIINIYPNSNPNDKILAKFTKKFNIPSRLIDIDFNIVLSAYSKVISNKSLLKELNIKQEKVDNNLYFLLSLSNLDKLLKEINVQAIYDQINIKVKEGIIEYVCDDNGNINIVLSSDLNKI